MSGPNGAFTHPVRPALRGRPKPRPMGVVDYWHGGIGDDLLLHKDHANEAELAQALAKALGLRSEADFYENLLRCKNDDQRKEKLLSKGMPKAEVERCLREYSGRSEAERPESKEVTTSTAVKPSTAAVEPPDGPIVRPVEPPQSVPPRELPVGPEVPPIPGRPFRLKDAGAVGYVLNSVPGTDPGSRRRGGGGGTSGQEGHQLTDQEKAQLEEAGRALAARELERMGYKVEEMSQKNPGFDLRATKGSEELRVEVKAHTGGATVVDVTQRQYKEHRWPQGYRWELWNVEHLAEGDASPVTITRYDDIPDDALDARTFRVDLRKCRSPASPSAVREQSHQEHGF